MEQFWWLFSHIQIVPTKTINMPYQNFRFYRKYSKALSRAPILGAIKTDHRIFQFLKVINYRPVWQILRQDLFSCSFFRIDFEKHSNVYKITWTNSSLSKPKMSGYTVYQVHLSSLRDDNLFSWSLNWRISIWDKTRKILLELPKWNVKLAKLLPARSWVLSFKSFFEDFFLANITISSKEFFYFSEN